MYPKSMPVRKGDRVMLVRGEGKSKSATVVAKVDGNARKIYVEGLTYFKSDGTELQRPIDPSNVVIINPDWADIRRRKLLTRVNESIEWTDDVVSEFEAAEDEYEAETLGVPEEKDEDNQEEVDTEEETDEVKEDTTSEKIDYPSMTVPELKDALKEKGLPVSGKKAELVERLEESN